MAEKLAIYDEEKTVAGLRAVNTDLDITITKFRELMGVVNQASTAFNRGTPREFIRGMQQAQTAQSGLRDVTNQLSDAERRLIAVERQLAIAQSDQAGQIANVSAQTRMLTAAQRERANTEQRLAQLSDRERSRLGNTMQIYNSVQQKLNRLQAEYRNLATAKQLGMNLTEAEIARMQRLERAIQRYDSTLKAVDASMGRHQRNVGNYASAYNGLNMSVAQLAREAPAFTYSVQTGFMAISNNLPIFFDSMRAARQENVRLRTEGAATVPVWKQLGAALFSWNTLMSIGITLLTVYGKEIGLWLKNLFAGSSATAMLTKNTTDLNEARKSAAKSAAAEISQLEILYRVATNENASKEARIRAINKLQSLYPSFFKNLSDEAIMVGKAKDQYLLLKAAILDSARARAIGTILEKRMEEQLLKEEEIQRRLNEEKANGLKIQKQGTQTEYRRDGQGGLILKEVQATDLLSRSINLQAGYQKQLNDIRTKGEKDSATLLNEKVRLENSKSVLAYEGDKFGAKDQPLKTPGASKLSAEQKDAIKDLEATRDTMLAVNEKMFVDGLQNERTYLEENLRINSEFFVKKMNLLKGNNAEERKQRADAELDQAKLVKDTRKKIFDIDYKEREENHKIKMTEFDRYSAEISEDQNLTDTDRLNKQIESDNKLIEELTSYYSDQIDLAKNANQQTLEIERKRDEEVGKVQDARLKKLGALPEAFNKDLDRISEISANMQNTDYEKIRLDILQKKMSLRDREFALNQLDLEFERISLLNQRNDLLLKKNQLEPLKEAGKLTKDQEKQYSEIESKVAGINSQLDITAKNLDQIKLDRFLEDLQPLRDLVGNGLNDLGLTNVANQFDEMFKKIIDGSFSAKDAVVLAASAISDGLTAINSRQKENTFAALDEQLKYTQETTEQEIGFINERLERLNSLETLTEEQAAERNRLEDEARTYKEQQFQREKLIEAQKARAEQKAAANQALINGALAATVTMAQLGFPAGVIPAAAAFGFGLAQSIAIMAKDPVPKYRVGRKGGKSEFAITQDGGREMITNSKGEIKSLGSDNGDTLTFLDRGDNVHTAKETKAILSRVGALPKVGDKIFQKIAMQSLMAPAPIVINKTVDNSDAIAVKVGKEFEKYLKKYDKPVTERVNGKIIRHRGANFGEVIGYYDITTGAEISFEDYQKNRSHD
ncbi:hypothetical protein ASG01_08840 [Chryseobacterium sp. Leaf180]|uniref:hypothetical protein n=1 Tax=Chryseobacterium sp. Leaf180 TaxID=1736289 RepID=UPI0006F99BCF|nr:hypothetical protein [Chryseobacterium sp. Leaf180]KQR93293.1 hypothetical protein ASG01_08840 [Chryseobacterium sp. Leaf180]